MPTVNPLAVSHVQDLSHSISQDMVAVDLPTPVAESTWFPYSNDPAIPRGSTSNDED